MRVALVHDWLIHMRGGEKVLESFAELYPDATIYTLFCRRSQLSESLRHRKIKTSPLQYFPGIRLYYRWLLPILPFFMRFLRVKDADIILSSSHCVAKGVRKPEGAKHICYCHTPMRYLWGFEREYFGNYPFILQWMIRNVLKMLKKWDLNNNHAVDFFISNSKNVKGRIQEFYDRDAHVIYPPYDASLFKVGLHHKNYYLVVSAFVPYKKVDIVIEAFNDLDRQLLIVGAGPLDSYYKKLRKNQKISFLGSVSGDQLKRLYSEARAVLFPSFEDFGIVPVEAQACGAPIIAFNRGGALESVKEGVFFDEQIPEAVRQAVLEFEMNKDIDRQKISESVLYFDKVHFKFRIQEFTDKVFKGEIEYVANA